MPNQPRADKDHATRLEEGPDDTARVAPVPGTNGMVWNAGAPPAPDTSMAPTARTPPMLMLLILYVASV